MWLWYHCWVFVRPRTKLIRVTVQEKQTVYLKHQTELVWLAEAKSVKTRKHTIVYCLSKLHTYNKVTKITSEAWDRSTRDETIRTLSSRIKAPNSRTNCCVNNWSNKLETELVSGLRKPSTKRRERENFWRFLLG